MTVQSFLAISHLWSVLSDVISSITWAAPRIFELHMFVFADTYST